ncbi:hypothetical protein SBY92_000705 [Candida maltosa Xu316]|uniref:Uncharacterized protein n=1 Tax=Candida maltosa (strain Xu316) TaxID=1245528 RepID=M3IGK4_CANMX|nr:hypothetical protein G210_4420 [Candida maltosa Xu316]
MVFNKVQTFLLHRIFKDLDKRLFEDNVGFPIVSAVETGSKSIPYEFIVNSPTTILKNQIFVYNYLIEKLKKFPLTEHNFEFFVYAFEYQHLFSKKEKLSKRDVIDLIAYVVKSCNRPIDASNLTETLVSLINPSVKIIIYDFLAFTKKFTNLTSANIKKAVAMTYAYEVFCYPTINRCINKTVNLNPEIVRGFIRDYYFRYLEWHESVFIELVEEVPKYCTNNFGSDAEQTTAAILDNMTLSGMQSMQLLELLEKSGKEYRRRRDNL